MSGVNITEFLLARIGEDERDLEDAPERAKELNDFGFGGFDDYLQVTMGYSRAVAECAAKRAIVALGGQALAVEVERRDASALGADLMHQDILRALAAVYADHPDYQKEWSDGAGS